MALAVAVHAVSIKVDEHVLQVAQAPPLVNEPAPHTQALPTAVNGAAHVVQVVALLHAVQ